MLVTWRSGGTAPFILNLGILWDKFTPGKYPPGLTVQMAGFGPQNRSRHFENEKSLPQKGIEPRLLGLALTLAVTVRGNSDDCCPTSSQITPKHTGNFSGKRVMPALCYLRHVKYEAHMYEYNTSNSVST
jgi:hypothetical protein